MNIFGKSNPRSNWDERLANFWPLEHHFSEVSLYYPLFIKHFRGVVDTFLQYNHWSGKWLPLKLAASFTTSMIVAGYLQPTKKSLVVKSHKNPTSKPLVEVTVVPVVDSDVVSSEDYVDAMVDWVDKLVLYLWPQDDHQAEKSTLHQSDHLPRSPGCCHNHSTETHLSTPSGHGMYTNEGSNQSLLRK